MITKLKFGFYKAKISTLKIIFLLIFILIEVSLIYLKQQNMDNESSIRIIKIIMFIFIWWFPLVTGISNSFRNIYFSLIWLLICLTWIKVSPNFENSILPLLTYIWVNFARVIFRYFFKYEPIFMLIKNFPHHTYNKIEKRKSEKYDFIFSLIVFIVGVILSIILS